MKKVLPYISLLVFNCSFAQNLVPNWSFEDTLKCVTNGNQFTGYVEAWTGWGGGGYCYFNSLCSTNDAVGVPQNTWGYRYAHTGNAYAGIYTFIDSLYAPTDANIRDYLQVQLISPLSASLKYYATFYVSLADSPKYACNDIGAYFSDSALTPSWYVKSYLTPQVANNGIKNPLTDKINWMKVSGSFVAKGGEQYVIIGNFKNDAHSDTVFVNSPASTAQDWHHAYYYIDDVIISADSNYADSLMAINEVKLRVEQMKVYPNPSKGIFNLSIRNLELGIKCRLEIYNMLGEKVYSSGFLIPNLSTGHIDSQFLINLTGNPSGIYLYRISDEEGNLISTGKLVIE
jgi:hypothetical protein